VAIKLLKVKPIDIDSPWSGYDPIIYDKETIEINIDNINMIQEIRIKRKNKTDLLFTKILMAGMSNSITIDMDIKKLRLLINGARQEAVEVLYG